MHKHHVPVDELKNHRYVLEFLNVLGFPDWDSVFEAKRDIEEIGDESIIDQFDEKSLKLKLRSIFPVDEVPKLRYSGEISRRKHIITLFRSICKYLGYDTKSEIRQFITVINPN